MLCGHLTHCEVQGNSEEVSFDLNVSDVNDSLTENYISNGDGGFN